MLVETELEVHAHHRKIVTLIGKHNIERRDVIRLSGFELSEKGFGVTEDIFRSNESFHCSVHTLDGNLS